MSTHQEWRTPCFLWLNAFRTAEVSPDDPPRDVKGIGYHGISLRPDADGEYLGAGILADRRRAMCCPSGWNSRWPTMSIARWRCAYSASWPTISRRNQ